MDMEMALGLVKARLTRPPGDTALDEYLKKRIEGAAAKLKRLGIHLTESAGDMPEWLKHDRRERWLAD